MCVKGDGKGGREGGGKDGEKGNEGKKEKKCRAQSTTGLHPGPPSASGERLLVRQNARETRFSPARYQNMLQVILEAFKGKKTGLHISSTLQSNNGN